MKLLRSNGMAVPVRLLGAWSFAGDDATRSPWSGWAPHSGSFDQYLAVPFWASDFMAIINSAFYDAVTAAECLAVLRRLAPEAFSDG